MPFDLHCPRFKLRGDLADQPLAIAVWEKAGPVRKHPFGATLLACGNRTRGVRLGIIPALSYTVGVIRSFRCRETARLFRDERSRKLVSIERVARRKLLALDAAARLEEVAGIPGNRLEALRGDRLGQCSIRINERYRICFRWERDGAHDVEIVDYH